MMRARHLLLLTTATLLAGCRSSRLAFLNPFSQEEPSPMQVPADDAASRGSGQVPGDSGWGSGVVDPEPRLYGWDGSPVNSAPPGVVQRSEQPLDGELDEADANRLVLLDLYTEAVKDRDGYLLEVEAQGAALEQAEGRYQGLVRSHQELQAALEKLDQEKRRLQVENQELAARLATAQIRRLEAERTWLEAVIEWRRLNEMNRQGMEKVAREKAQGTTGGTER